jgi:hypothetical protein
MVRTSSASPASRRHGHAAALTDEEQASDQTEHGETSGGRAIMRDDSSRASRPGSCYQSLNHP